MKSAWLCIALIFGASCAHKSKFEDPLWALLFGTAPYVFPVYSYTGPGNQGASMENLLISTIASGTSTVQCGFQDVNLPGVIRALQFAKGRGADVLVGLDEDNRDQPGHLQLRNFLTDTGEGRKLHMGNAGAGQVYSNICVADRTKVFLSTAPPTVQGFYGEPAFAMYFQDSETEAPKKFQSEMDLMTHGSFGSSKQVLNRQNFYLITDMEMGAYMAPKDNPLEGFMVPRVRQATNSIQIFSSEFFSNELDASDLRETGDLAYEVRFSAVPSKQIVTTTYAASAADPDEAAALNSRNYLANNGIAALAYPGAWPDNGVNVVLLDATTYHPLAMLTSFPLASRSGSSHDGFMLIFEYRPMVDGIASFFNQLQARSSSLSGTGEDQGTAGSMDVVISELNWMGGYDSAGSGTTSEYIELYNNTDRAINISGWRVQCGTLGGFATLAATLPAQSVIGPGQYFVVVRTGGTVVLQAHSIGIAAAGVISDAATDQCRITDGAANGDTVVDVIGVSGTNFSTNTVSFGLNDTTNQIRKSMERQTLNASGANTTNWRTNRHTANIQNLNFYADRILKTFGTPGYANSQ